MAPKYSTFEGGGGGGLFVFKKIACGAANLVKMSSL